MQMYSPSAGSETLVAEELSDRYELAGTEGSHGGSDPVSASGAGIDGETDVGAGGGFGPLDVDAPEPQPAAKQRPANAVVARRIIDAQTAALRSRFHTVALLSGEAVAGSIIDRWERRLVDIEASQHLRVRVNAQRGT